MNLGSFHSFLGVLNRCSEGVWRVEVLVFHLLLPVLLLCLHRLRQVWCWIMDSMDISTPAPCFCSCGVHDLEGVTFSGPK